MGLPHTLAALGRWLGLEDDEPDPLASPAPSSSSLDRAHERAVPAPVWTDGRFLPGIDLETAARRSGELARKGGISLGFLVDSVEFTLAALGAAFLAALVIR